MGQGVAWLTAVVAGIWLVSLVPALHLVGGAGPWISLLAGAVCLVPAAGTWLVVYWSLGRTLSCQLAVTLGGPAVRILVVLVVGGGFLAASDALRSRWLLFVTTGVVYYLATLATETVLSIRYRQRRSQSPGRN